MKSITLTQGKSTIVDDEMYDYLIQWTCNLVAGYARCYKKGKTISMHRLIMNAPDGVQVDHINGDKLDNRRENLRLCTITENLHNRGSYKNNTSGFKGVTQRRNRYEANISVNGVPIYLGAFLTPEAAARAYDKAARIHHGPFAWLNFPD